MMTSDWETVHALGRIVSKSASGAAEYFAKDDKHPGPTYYVGDGGSGGAGSPRWQRPRVAGQAWAEVARAATAGLRWGSKHRKNRLGRQGRRVLGLSGEVTKDAFEKIPQWRAAQWRQDRPGAEPAIGDRPHLLDCPNRPSILALVSGDERILTAHWNAVRETMSWVEGKFAEGRTYERTKSGEPVRTGNLVYAMFAHDTSRALDPQAHIHCASSPILPKAWRTAPGRRCYKWPAVDEQLGYWRLKYSPFIGLPRQFP